MATVTNKDLAFQHIEAEINLMQKTSQRSVIRANQYAIIHGAVKAYLNLGVLSDREAQQFTKTALVLLQPYPIHRMSRETHILMHLRGRQ